MTTIRAQRTPAFLTTKLTQFNRLIDHADTRYSDAMKRAQDHSLRITSEVLQTRAAVLVTRLWNWIDCQDIFEPEGLWAHLAQLCGWAFENPADVNSIRFTY